MAYSTSGLDGTVSGVSAAYPWGDLKNAPSGTRINRKMMADIWQLMQLLMNAAGITPNNLPDNKTNGYQLMAALTGSMNAHVEGILKQKMGITLDNTTVYVLYGCETYEDDGVVFYAGKVYYVKGTGAPVSCGGSDVKILALNTEVYGRGMRQMDVKCGPSGSGVKDFTDIIHLGKWSAESSTVFTPSGGTITIDSGDIVYNRYYVDGNTITWQLKVRTATFASGVDDITIEPTFLTASGKTIANFGASMIGGLCNDGIMVADLITTGVVIRPLTGSFTDGTNDRNFDLNITFEIE